MHIMKKSKSVVLLRPGSHLLLKLSVNAMLNHWNIFFFCSLVMLVMFVSSVHVWVNMSPVAVDCDSTMTLFSSTS